MEGDCTEQVEQRWWWDVENPASLVVHCTSPLAKCRIKALAARTSQPTSCQFRDPKHATAIMLIPTYSDEALRQGATSIEQNPNSVVTVQFTSLERSTRDLDLQQHIHIDAARHVLLLSSCSLLARFQLACFLAALHTARYCLLYKANKSSICCVAFTSRRDQGHDEGGVFVVWLCC